MNRQGDYSPNAGEIPRTHDYESGGVLIRLTKISAVSGRLPNGDMKVPIPTPDEGKIQWGHFILRVQSETKGRGGLVFVVEDVRSGRRARYEKLEEALAFIQAHLSPEDE